MEHTGIADHDSLLFLWIRLVVFVFCIFEYIAGSDNIMARKKYIDNFLNCALQIEYTNAQ